MKLNKLKTHTPTQNRVNTRIFAIFPVLAFICFANYSTAEIYKWVDEYGQVHFGDKESDTFNSVEVKEPEDTANTYTNVTVDNVIFEHKKKEKRISKKVVMYATSWCGYCEKARRYFKKNKIKFTEYNIETSKKAKAKYDKLGAKGVPVIFVGKRRMNGFSESSFQRIYKN